MALGQEAPPGPEVPPGPDGLPPATPAHPWKIFYGASNADTLPYPQTEVVRAARRQLVTDQWQIYVVDSARGVVVSKWKALRHPLLSRFIGKAWMRCVVHVELLGRNRTRIIFRADLASREVLTENPLFGEAKRAYATAAQNYLIKVRQYLYDHGRRTGPARSKP